MKKILFLLFTLASFASFGQTTNVFKWIEMKSVDTTAFPMRVGQFWYNPTVGKFTFHDASGYTHFGIGGLTNTAANNEFPKSTGSGSGIVASGLFSSTLGNLDLGTTSLSGDRTISAKSSSTNNSLYFQTTNGSSTATNALQLFISGTKTIVSAPPGNLSLNGSFYGGRSLIGSPSGFDFANYPTGLSEVVGTNINAPSTVLLPFRIAATASAGTPANGFGVGMEFAAQNSAGTNVVGSSIHSVFNAVTPGLEGASFVIKNIVGGVLTENIRFTSQGGIGLSGANFGTSGQVLTSGGVGAAASWTTVAGGGGTVSTVSVVSANGLAGTVANPTTTPAITLSTTFTGLAKSNGTAFSAASAGTDYQAPITLTTTGVSGASTFIGNTLNVPNYSTPVVVYNVKSYGAKGDGVQTSANGTVSSGSPNFTCSTCTFVVGDVGKTIEIPGAGAAGVNKVTTISAYVSATAVTLASNASASVTTSICWYGTDDTAAIQTTINTCFTAGGGRIFLPNGVYIIAGALVTSDLSGNNPNAQLYIPSPPIVSSIPIIQTIYIEGEGWQPYGPYSPGYTRGSILKSTLTTGTGTRPSLLGGVGQVGYTYPFSYSSVYLKYLNFITSSNGGATATNMIAVNGLNLAQISTQDMNISPDRIPQLVNTVPTPLGTGSAGLVIGQGNNDGPNHVINTIIQGYEHGFVLGEHTFLENDQSICNYNAITVIPNNFYSIEGYIYVGESAYYINRPNTTFFGVTPATLIYQAINLTMDIEHTNSGIPSWANYVANTNDAGDLLMGEVAHKVASGTYAGWQNSNQITGNTTSTHLNWHPMSAAFAGAYSTSGGPLGHYPGFPNTANVNNYGVFEVSSGLASAGTGTGLGILDITTNQSGTAHAVAVINAVNSNITGGVSENRLWELAVSTNGATNTGKRDEYMLNAGSFVLVSSVTPTIYGLAIPVLTGTTTSNVYRNTNAGGDVTPKFVIDPASSLTAGIAYTFDATNGFGFTQGNATRRIQGAAIKPSGLTSTAGSEVMGLDFFTQSGGTAATSKMTLNGAGNLTIGALNNIVGVATNNSATAGNIGEEINAIQSTYTNYTISATYQNIASITLTAGDWDISGFGSFSTNTSTITAASNAIFVVSTTTASAAGATEGRNIAYIPQAALLGTSIQSTATVNYRVSISGSTTYYLNTQATFTVGNPQFVGSIRARRMR